MATMTQCGKCLSYFPGPQGVGMCGTCAQQRRRDDALSKVDVAWFEHHIKAWNDNRAVPPLHNAQVDTLAQHLWAQLATIVALS